MDAKAEKAREYVAECLNNYKEVSGTVLPKVISIDRIFTEPDRLKENVYVLTNYILENKNANPEDMQLITAFHESWKKFRYPTLNQTRRVLSMYKWYNQRKSEISYQKAERIKMSHIFADENPSMFAKALRQKERRPFYKTKYEKEKEREKHKKDALMEKDASYTFAVSNKYAFKDNVRKTKMIKEISGLLDILDKREKFIMEECLKNESTTDIAEKLHISRSRVSAIYQKAVGKISLYRLNQEKPILERQIESIGISSSTARALARASINNVKELTEKTEQEISGMGRMGHHSINEIKQALADKGLSLKKDYI